MTPIVVDPSVALKWFVPEKLSDQAVRLLDGTHELVAPDLLIPECGNVLRTKIARKEIDVDEGRAILQALGRVPIRVVASGALVEGALEIALAVRTTVSDGLYVALAVARDCALVTADDRLARTFAGGPLAPTVRSLKEFALWIDLAEPRRPRSPVVQGQAISRFR